MLGQGGIVLNSLLKASLSLKLPRLFDRLKHFFAH